MEVNVSPALKPKRLRSGKTARFGPATGTASQTQFVAIVHAADGIRFAVAAATRRELIQRLAEYARQRGDHALRPDHARHLRALLVRGELEAAVETYFGLVGQRWDEEWLVTAIVSPNDYQAVVAAVDEVILADALSERPRLRDAS
jgi:hypothetical protein